MDAERVQSIASLSKQDNTIPADFIRSATEQPGESTVRGVVLEVPVIDVSTGDEKNIIEQIREASIEWGMFQVVNHSVPDHLISKLQQVGKEFFELPIEEKELIKKTPESGIEGYGTNLQKVVDGKKGWVDHLFHKVWPPSVVKYDFWPKNPPSYREVTEEYGKKMRELSDDLMKWLSLGLGLDGQKLKMAVGGDELNFLLKINYYPPCPCPDLVLGVVAHTDMSALTILVPNEIQGLQVFRNDHWYDVRYIPNALIIHIGDQMEIMSNGKYKAVFHRSTVNKDCTRMSWPVFLEPPAEREVGPVPELVNEKNPAKYKTKKYKDYAYCKLNKIPQ